jgi:glycopeptide antibiotics resistance protein
MYSFLGFLALLENRCHNQCRRQHLFLLFLIFGMSAIIEILQATVVSSRSAEWKDLVANLAGLTAGYIAYRIIRKVIT